MKKKPPICPNCKKPIGGIYNGKLQIVGWDWEGHNCHPESTPAPELFTYCQTTWDAILKLSPPLAPTPHPESLINVSDPDAVDAGQYISAKEIKNWYTSDPRKKAPAPEIPKYYNYCTCSSIMEFENAIHSAIAEQMAEKQRLADWKESALKVMPDFQVIGKLLGVRLGDSVHDKIIPGIQSLQNQLAAKEKEVEKLKGLIETAWLDGWKSRMDGKMKTFAKQEFKQQHKL